MLYYNHMTKLGSWRPSKIFSLTNKSWVTVIVQIDKSLVLYMNIYDWSGIWSVYFHPNMYVLICTSTCNTCKTICIILKVLQNLYLYWQSNLYIFYVCRCLSTLPRTKQICWMMSFHLSLLKRNPVVSKKVCLFV